tara:strand:- start:1576 stop:2562 length:987 start_codon:yes stop_codon:yes gene_type:complete
MKRGVVSPVFTYIFVLIVGGIILWFFTSFAFQQLNLGNKLSSIEISKTLDDNLDAFAISKNSDKDINFGMDLNLLINNLVCGTLSSDDGNNLRTNKVIFSPKSLKGDSIKTWTLSWKYPFHVTNFFYLSNENSFYYIVHDGNSEEYVKNKFFSDSSKYKIPSRFKVRRINKNDVNNDRISNLLNQYSFVKLIYFTTPNNLASNDRLKIIEIKEDSNLVKFHNENKEEILLSDEHMLGAIFSEDYKSFRCGFDDSVDKLKSLSKLYLEKQSKLKSKGLTCNYNIVNSNLNYFIDTNPDKNNFETYKGNRNNLIINNNDLEGVDNCASLF